MKLYAAILLGLAVLATVLFAGRLPVDPPTGVATAAAVPVANVTPAAPAPAPAGTLGETIRIDRDPSGQFHLDAAVDGSATRFLIDTGADVVALTEDDARRAGIAVSTADYQPILQTASGQGYGARVKLDRVQVGQAELRDVDAVVVRELAVSLLGQSVLRRVGRVELRGDQIVIEPGA